MDVKQYQSIIDKMNLLKIFSIGEKEAVAKLQFSTANIPGKCFGSL
ncbi:MAG: hypothetical protein LBD20_01850 [Spirochaetaceae bacterium]|nr:hypothetical protein [Spirochaetaceae bacterium]